MANADHRLPGVAEAAPVVDDPGGPSIGTDRRVARLLVRPARRMPSVGLLPEQGHVVGALIDSQQLDVAVLVEREVPKPEPGSVLLVLLSPV